MKKYFLWVPFLTLLISCAKEDVKPAMSVKNNNLILFHESTEALVVENNPGDLTFKSENSLIANLKLLQP